MLCRTVLLLLSLSVSAAAQAPAADQHSASLGLTALRFLAGRWTSATEEEYWSKPMGESMVGTYRVIKDGKPTFYEFWVIELEEGKPVYKMKHFNTGLQGWEHKDEFVRLPVTESSPNAVTFSDGKTTLHYERHGERLDGTLDRVVSGKPRQDAFHLRLAH